MAQLNITLNQDEILQLLGNDRDEAFRTLLQNSLNNILKAESAEQLKAAPYQRTKERTDSRNGTRERTLLTRIGNIELQVPRHRNQPFKTMVFDNYSRSEAALIASMAEMVVNGVSTRKVSRVMETLCGTAYSKSAVSEVCKEMDSDGEEFRQRPLTEPYPFLLIDATYFKVRENHRVISKAFMVAYGISGQGKQEILGFGVYHSESKETWHDFLQGLKDRGLKGLLMITSDAHEGIRDAITRVFPDVPWQRCQFHFSKNIADKTPKRYQSALRAELQEMYRSHTIEEARQKRDAIIREYQDVAESAMTCLDEGFESAMTVINLSSRLRLRLRTSNALERVNRELKRRSRVIGVFPNEASVQRLMGAVLTEIHQQWQEAMGIFGTKSYALMMQSDLPARMVKIAREQRALMAA